MGLFSNIGNTFSGKNYKHNTLINPNISHLYREVEHLESDDIIRLWVLQASASIAALLEVVLFDDMCGEDGKSIITLVCGTQIKINPIKQHLGKLNVENTFEFFKLIGGFFLIIFLLNKNNTSLIEKTGSSNEEFKNNIFFIFKFKTEDKNFYEEISKKIEKTPSSCFISIYKRIFEEMLNTPNYTNLIASTAFSSLLTSHYEVFMTLFNEKTSNLKRAIFFRK